MIKKDDRKFLIQGLPVYFVLLVLIAGMVILYRQKLSRHGNEPLGDLISKNLRGFQPQYQTIDEVINSRKTWEPVLPDWQGREVPDLTFFLLNGECRHLADYRGRECIVIIGATWFPPFRLQISQVLQALNWMEEEKPTVIGLTAESLERIEKFSKKLTPEEIQIGRIENLPEPFSLPDGFPCIFFLDAQGRLKLAAIGLIPRVQVEAVCRLPLPEGKEQAN
ncbi:MAG TPA: redoxin domain-containing protein [Anaerohalosphaeraceae bacterium]|nr:redoxin domain-containing protein [Anaerohalosphaeraceae bacterium]HOL87879.1 redoxin domain-containing protein [Anaerohalosphaeraceae bacterium]HPP55234.1 redoxin domain-containing protein [Anaerohalosphaeraceae bacterium]